METNEGTLSVFTVLGRTGCGLLIVLVASGIASVASLIDLVVLRRRWLQRHTLWVGVLSPLATSSLANFIAARRIISSYDESLYQPVASLVAFIYLSSILGLLCASLGCLVHILTTRIGARPDDSPPRTQSPNDRDV